MEKTIICPRCQKICEISVGYCRFCGCGLNVTKEEPTVKVEPQPVIVIKPKQIRKTTKKTQAKK